MNACPLYVKINDLSVLTWLQTPCLCVVGGQCTAGRPECKEQNWQAHHVWCWWEKGVSHFLKLGDVYIMELCVPAPLYGCTKLGILFYGIDNTWEIS